ncbi:hypothetical protein Bcoa_2009 [Heyndrickxia coagulans 36D1]|uniref:Uncharacterized protein n=1 Tax=Heyndrickxia coagulans 36D1 TaxID=345219 RepID=G2TMX0_HEYCO|nr:hypothetical protein Bcoa_2009 [Heyndrickxia coagulans 36D1]
MMEKIVDVSLLVVAAGLLVVWARKKYWDRQKR